LVKQIDPIPGTAGERGTMSNLFRTSGTSPTSNNGADFRCENHGSIFLLYPLNESAKSWIEENLPSDVQWFGQVVAVEHRFIWEILTAFKATAWS
jgi:hypothetical protein